MRLIGLVPCVIPLALCGAVMAAPGQMVATRPATRPATAPAATRAVAATATASDLSTPQTAVITFLTALVSGDEKAATGTVTFENTPDAASAHVFLDILFSTNKIQRAARDKFGTAADEQFGNPQGALEARIAAVKQATPAVMNNDAALTLPPEAGSDQPGTTISLVHSATGWRIDAASLFQLSALSPEDIGKRVALGRKIMAINELIAQNITDGKYASAKEARTDLWDKSFAAAAELNGASTRPNAATMGAEPATKP